MRIRDRGAVVETSVADSEWAPLLVVSTGRRSTTPDRPSIGMPDSILDLGSDVVVNVGVDVSMEPDSSRCLLDAFGRDPTATHRPVVALAAW